MCMKALRGTGVDPPVPVVLLELPLEPLLLLETVVRELDALPDEADPPDDPDNTLALPALVDAEESAEVELALDVVVLLARLRTDGVVVKDEPLALDAGDRRELVAPVFPDPAPEEEPAVLEATAAVVPLVEPWI
jgi:hypothetical protein